jgi:hypothetical protein
MINKSSRLSLTFTWKIGLDTKGDHEMADKLDRYSTFNPQRRRRRDGIKKEIASESSSYINVLSLPRADDSSLLFLIKKSCMREGWELSLESVTRQCSVKKTSL